MSYYTKASIVITQPLTNTYLCLSFYYHMYGSDINLLQIRRGCCAVFYEIATGKSQTTSYDRDKNCVCKFTDKQVNSRAKDKADILRAVHE